MWDTHFQLTIDTLTTHPHGWAVGRLLWVFCTINWSCYEWTGPLWGKPTDYCLDSPSQRASNLKLWCWTNCPSTGVLRCHGTHVVTVMPLWLATLLSPINTSCHVSKLYDSYCVWGLSHSLEDSHLLIREGTSWNFFHKLFKPSGADVRISWDNKVNVMAAICPRPHLNRPSFPGMGIPMLKIRRSVRPSYL